MSADDHAILLFDGVCNFCNGTVNFIIRHDRRGYFRFAPLQEAAGERLQAKYGLNPDQLDTFVVIEGRRPYTQSTAALRIARGLGGVWRLAYAFIVVPRPVRDWVYGFFARRRYRLFGRREECMVPSPDVRERFLVE